MEGFTSAFRRVIEGPSDSWLKISVVKKDTKSQFSPKSWAPELIHFLWKLSACLVQWYCFNLNAKSGWKKTWNYICAHCSCTQSEGWERWSSPGWSLQTRSRNARPSDSARRRSSCVLSAEFRKSAGWWREKKTERKHAIHARVCFLKTSSSRTD